MVFLDIISIVLIDKPMDFVCQDFINSQNHEWEKQCHGEALAALLVDCLFFPAILAPVIYSYSRNSIEIIEKLSEKENR